MGYIGAARSSFTERSAMSSSGEPTRAPEAPSEPNTTTVAIRFLVTNHAATLLPLTGDEREDREVLAGRVEDAVREGATTLHVQDVAIVVPLPAATSPPIHIGPDTATRVEIPPDIRARIEEVIRSTRERHTTQTILDAQTVIGVALTPGRYEVYEDRGGKGIRRLDP